MRAVAWVLLVLVLLAVGVSVAWRLLASQEEPLEIEPGAIRLVVVNGCALPRLARAIADELEARGFAVYGTGNSPEVYEHTTVVDLLDPEGGCAAKVARALSVRPRKWFLPVGRKVMPAVTVELDSARLLEVLVVVGGDHKRFFPDVVVLR